MRIEFSKDAKNFLKKCEKDLYTRLVNKIKKLSENPFPNNCKRIKGVKEKVFRIRVGDYRILYEIYFEKDLILVSEINKRDRIYN